MLNDRIPYPGKTVALQRIDSGTLVWVPAKAPG